MIVVSTSETYGTAQYVPIDEKHPIVPQSPYAATKSAAEQLALSYYRSFGAGIKVVKPFNIYGPRQSARAVVPTIITQALTGDRIFVGSLHPTRDLTYVADVVDGLIGIAGCEACNGIITNLGSGFEISVSDLAKKILEIVGKEMEIVSDPARVRPAESEVERLCADTSLAKRLINWKPGVPLADGLKTTVEWISAHIERFRSDIYNI
jgi:nucleoside-diphosphate-sugar epimerase